MPRLVAVEGEVGADGRYGTLFVQTRTRGEGYL